MCIITRCASAGDFPKTDSRIFRTNSIVVWSLLRKTTLYSRGLSVVVAAPRGSRSAMILL
jgi:hypothetical protein